jgi:tRNA threonylcarbamoyladenosine biosynthesis protein TsaE
MPIMTLVPIYELPYFVGNVLAALAILPAKDTATLVTLRGELGSGKTTFVQEFARKLGITDIVQSPTYVLMKSYPFSGDRTSFGRPRRYDRLVHIDAYRLLSPEEFDTIKPQEFLSDPRALVLLEWPERVEGRLPKPDLMLKFSSGAGEMERIIEMEQ